LKKKDMMTKPRILLTRRWPDAAEARLAERYDVVRDKTDTPLDRATLTAAMGEFDALCPTVSDTIDAAVIGTGPARVKIIGNYGVGFNHIDVAAAKRAGIVVTNTPGVLTDATADIALTLLLMVARRASEGERQLRAGGWAGWAPTHMMGQALTGKTLGLIGLGRIAHATAARAAHGFGMKILYSAPRRKPADYEAAVGATFVESIEALLPQVDFLSLHCPGGAATHHLLDAKRLALLKPTAAIVNTARGTVIDEAALAEALAARRIAGAGLDVYEQEPVVHPALLALENVVLLPHLGSATIETRMAMGLSVADNLDAFFDHREPRDRVA
jgi:lactate dehydrogenase-like 2-hydroxyacid dehydrogenase